MNVHPRFRIILFAVLLIATGLIPGVVASGPGETLVITGTGASIGTMGLMAEAFQRKNPGVIVQVLPSIGSTGGIKAVTADKIDIGLSYRPLKPEEQSAAIIEEAYGRTAFVFGVQDSNPTQGFTLVEIEEVYSGQRQTWPDGTPIRLILRPLSDGLSTYLAGINSGLKSASEKAHAIPGVFVGITDQDAAAQIEKTPGSFGTTSLSLIISEKRRIKALPINGISPTLANISTGQYPYSMMLFLVYKKEKYRDSTKAFIEFVFSMEGQRILAENGQVPLPCRPSR